MDPASRRAWESADLDSLVGQAHDISRKALIQDMLKNYTLNVRVEIMNS